MAMARLILVAGSYNGRSGDGLYVMLNEGTGGFGLGSALYRRANTPALLAATDLNGDGKVDLLAADSELDAPLTVRFNPEQQELFPALAEDFAAYGQTFQDAADIDGDGDIDLFTSGPHPIGERRGNLEKRWRGSFHHAHRDQ